MSRFAIIIITLATMKIFWHRDNQNNAESDFVKIYLPRLFLEKCVKNLTSYCNSSSFSIEIYSVIYLHQNGAVTGLSVRAHL